MQTERAVFDFGADVFGLRAEFDQFIDPRLLHEREVWDDVFGHLHVLGDFLAHATQRNTFFMGARLRYVGCKAMVVRGVRWSKKCTVAEGSAPA